jgi:hypothetical protein
VQRKAWLEANLASAHNAVLYANTSLADVYGLPLGVVNAFFSGEAYKNWKKIRESETKLAVAVVERLNGVISAISVVVKTLGRMGR